MRVPQPPDQPSNTGHRVAADHSPAHPLRLLWDIITKSTSPGIARQLVTFFCFAKKKVTQEKATPVCRRFAVPCVARLVRRLRNSHYVLRQSSPKFPDQPPLLGGAQGKKKQKVWCALRARFLICRQRSACYAGDGSDRAKCKT